MDAENITGAGTAPGSSPGRGTKGDKMKRTPEEKERIKKVLEKYLEEHREASRLIHVAAEAILDAIDIVRRYEKSFSFHGLTEAYGKVQVPIIYISGEIANSEKLLENIIEKEEKGES
jgi:ABC-type Zn uptake system ZnuABC Zn-binding protein ZnuA